MFCPQSCGRQAGGDPDMMKTDPCSVLRPSSEFSCPTSPTLPGPLVCVNIDNNRECPGACMQFFSVSNVQVYSLPPVALRRLRGLVESGACEQWRNVAGGWWSPDTGDNVLADRPHQYTSQSPVCNMHTATDTQTDRQNYRSTSIAFHE